MTDSSNKENIPPLYSNERYKFTPTMVNVREEFDKKYKLPKVRKEKLTPQEKTEARNKKKEELQLKLAEVEDKMKQIKNTK